MAACPTGNPVADLIVGFFDFLGDPIGTILKGIANSVLGAAVSVFGDLTTNVPTLVPGGTAQEISAQTQWVVVYVAVASLIFAAARMAIERRGEAGHAALKGLVRVVLVAGGATAVTTALASLSDRFADHLFAAGAQQQLTAIGCSDATGVDSFLLLVLAFLLLIAAIVQTVLLFVRLGVMIILLGTLPMAAAASMTNWGSGWWRKHIGWMIAWLLYKPAAALVLFAGSAMIAGTGTGGGAAEKIAGIGVMLLSALALPALLKLIVPATAALGGDGGAGQGTLAAAGAVASGARSVGSAVMSAASPEGGVRSGPSGASGPAGGSGRDGRSGPGGLSHVASPGGGAAAAGGGAAALAGPLGAAVGRAATGAGRFVAGSVEGADGERGHNG